MCNVVGELYIVKPYGIYGDIKVSNPSYPFGAIIVSWGYTLITLEDQAFGIHVNVDPERVLYCACLRSMCCAVLWTIP